MLRKRIQLGLLHMAVAMTLVPINSTLNRVMIKELALSATLVAVLASFPYLFSPIQIAIGSFADRHPIMGFRRTPYILIGLILVVAGVMTAPQVAFYMADHPVLGILIGILVFGMWGMGFNFAAVSYLSLASEISGEKGRSRTIAVMFFMMISGIIITALLLSRLLDPYSPEVMVSAFRLVGMLALSLGLIGLIRLETRSATPVLGGESRQSVGTLLPLIFENRQVTLFFFYLVLLLAAILGQDILLEPFAAQAFHLPVNITTRITSIWGVCVLFSLVIAGVLEGRIAKRSIARFGGLGAILAFLVIVFSGMILNLSVFYVGVVLLGLATGVASVSNLSLMLDMTVEGRVGMFMGAWGMADSFARLSGSVLSGAVRDVVSQFATNPVSGYLVVFSLQATMLIVSLLLLRKIDVSLFRQEARALSVVERAAIASEA